MTDRPRLIEVAFPLKQASLDSVHEKNVRHGHISTLHIWPARRPLAASRAALIATLLPDPGDAEERKKLLEKLGGKVVEKVERKKVKGKVTETRKEETEGGILHWGREASPDLDWFREKIREAYGGRAPRVLDPFSGGGAIPLEAMRLGCEVTAFDINQVAWFILKCTLEYPQKLAGQKLPLPAFAFKSPDFIESWESARTKASKKGGKQKPGTVDMWDSPTPPAELAWHVRAWGNWVLDQARTELNRFYPMSQGRLVVAYLWARTVRCKGCGATLPLLKTRWLSKKDGNKALLVLKPRKDRSGVDFSITTVPSEGGRSKKSGTGTMSRSGAQCPCCPAIMTMEDLRLAGRAGRIGVQLIATVSDGEAGKVFHLPTPEDVQAAELAKSFLPTVFRTIPFGVPTEPTPSSAGSRNNSSSLRIYGFDTWESIYTPRQLVAIGTLLRCTREARDRMVADGMDPSWVEAVSALLAVALDRTANYMSTICVWDPKGTEVKQTFLRYAFPITWDFAEANPLCQADRYYVGAVSTIAEVLARYDVATFRSAERPRVVRGSAIGQNAAGIDVVVTDPPYYDAIQYADLMDFFYVWLRRVTHGWSDELDRAFVNELSPKWDVQRADGELVDDPRRHGGDATRAKDAYESGMASAFSACYRSLASDGRMVVVFANKSPDAWEALVSAVVRAGFLVVGTWPIATEMRGGVRNLGRSSLASSVWIVCAKRSEMARPGWDNRVLEEMRARIYERLHYFWDAGIRGPDFVWAATGPALEIYSKHPIVKKANDPGRLMTVSEFLRHVRRIVVDFAVGRVLTGDSGAEAVAGLDDVTTYYLLHRHYFGLGKAPVGACILYAVSCGLSDRDLSDRYDLIVRAGGKDAASEEQDDDDEEDDEESDEEDSEVGAGGGSGNKVKLKPWDQRRGKNLGQNLEGRPAPLIDQIHRLMHIWGTGELAKVDEYLDARALRKNQLFHQLLQALIELAPEKSEERAKLESLSNHVGARGRATPKRQLGLAIDTEG